MTDDSSSLQVNDPVLVSTNEGNQLEGVICYIGTVPELSNDDEEYVGIRLTGPSVGHGTNDGSIKQQNRYFDCPMNCGLFVLKASSTITKRNLTRLEVLRLRRELASTATTTSATTPASSSSTSISTSMTTGRLTPPRESLISSSTTTAASVSTTPTVSETIATTTSSSVSAATRTRLEEIKMRREALKLQQQQATAIDITPTKMTSLASQPLSSITSSSATNPLDDTIGSEQQLLASLKIQIKDLTDQLSARDKENVTLKRELDEQKLQLVDLQQKLVSPATTATNKSTSLQDTIEFNKLQEANLKLQSSYDDMKDQLHEKQNELKLCQEDLRDKIAANELNIVELTRARAEATSYQNQLREQQDQSDQRGMSDAVHYKERAKLSADISALKRKVDQLEKEKMDLEAAIEDITLDKEQLQEEKDAIEEKYEELKLDAETAQMEVEELRIELDDAKATASRVMGVADTLTTAALASAGSPSKISSDNSPDTIEMIQSLQTQNARLREALIRLREQSSLEKMEITRQLRSVEKTAEANTASQSRLDELSAINQSLNEQINDLKDMVEQGAAFESMVEDLSDRVLMLEEQNIVSNTIIRELEEAAELTAEMEEVQADELKALSRDVEGRDTIIRNLEEAIKMQKRREDDLRRTVGNYKSTVESLRQEKQALLELQQGGEGEKNNLVASSQKALSRAAQLVSEAAMMRKRESVAVTDRINRIMYNHMSNRLESMLPQSVVSMELSSMKGEIIASRVICKSSNVLSGIFSLFRKSIRPSLPESSDNISSEPLNLQIPDELQQELRTTFHQIDFAHVIAGAAAEIIRFVAAGQWPDFLSVEESAELGTILGHSLAEFDESIGALLKTLKEEGSLTIEQSSVGDLQLAFQNTMQVIRADVERDDKVLVDSSWNPPGWALLRDISLAKFACLGTSSAISLVLDSNTQSASTQSALNKLYSVVEQCSSFASSASYQLSNIDLLETNQVVQLSAICSEFLKEANSMMGSTKVLLLSNGDISSSVDAASKTLRVLSNFAMELRSKNFSVTEGETYHPLSPEVEDPWNGITHLVRSIRSVDNDSEDVNFLLRSKAIEQRLGDAVDNEPKLEWATARISDLEKALSSRTKELAMQNARLSELEKLMAKSNTAPLGRGANFDLKSSEEYNNLQEENRVLTEAIDVLQREVEKYESEIRSLKDFKSPKRGNTTGSRATPMKSNVLRGGAPSYRGGTDDYHSSNTLEATLFRPALQQAIHEAAHWKAVATGKALIDLAPLPTFPFDFNASGGDHDAVLLSTTIAKARIQKATISLVNLNNKDKAPRAQLREMKARNAAISQDLEAAFLRCRGLTPTY